MPGAIAVRSRGVKRAAVYQRRRPALIAGLKICAPQMAHVAERGCVGLRSWQGAVSVVDCGCCAMVIVQYLLVRPTNPFLN